MVNKSDIFRKKAPEWIINKKIVCNYKYIQNLLFQTKTNLSLATTYNLVFAHLEPACGSDSVNMSRD